MSAELGFGPGRSPPTLFCEAAELAAGSERSSKLSFSSHAARLALVGDWSLWFRALVQEAEVAAGRAEIAGAPLGSAIRLGVVGFAAADPALPDSLAVSEYLEHAGRLSGLSRADAEREATRVLERFGLGAIAKRSLRGLHAAGRRALGLAQASLGAPAVVCLESPLGGLDAASQDYVAELLGRIPNEQRLVFSVLGTDRSGPERSLLDTADELVWLERGALSGQGRASELLGESEYLVTVAGATERLIEALRERGCEVSRLGAAGVIAALLGVDDSDTLRLRVRLPERLGPDAILEAAQVNGAALIELVPIASERDPVTATAPS